MKKLVISVVWLTILSKVFGFMREISIAYRYGASVDTDIYFIAVSIPVMFIGSVVNGINTSLIPTLTKADSVGEKDKFYTKYLSLLVVFSAVYIVFMLIFAYPVGRLVAIGYDSEHLATAVRYSRYLAAVGALQVFSWSFIGYNQQQNKFNRGASNSIPPNVLIVLFVMLSKPGDIRMLVIGTILGYVAQFVWTGEPIVFRKVSFKWDFDLKDEHIRMFLSILLPVLITLSAYRLNLIVDRSLASTLETGSISILTYANRIITLIYGVMVITLSTVLYTKQSHLAIKENYFELYETTKKNVSLIMMLIIPVVAGTIMMRYELVKLIYERGGFTSRDTRMVADVLMFYSFSILGITIREIFSKMYFSKKNTKKPMIATFVSVGTNIILSFILIRYMGINGLALATSIGAIMGAGTLVYFAKKDFRKKDVNIYFHSFHKYIISVIIMTASYYYSTDVLRCLLGNMHLVLVGRVLAGVFTYFTGLALLKTEELVKVRTRLSAFLHKR